jgi:GalNAc-alpha-(1->4)-GalNAc-alpha-(1->3)-diNAcBac-PP-undecaprenol alpha-1,4-N-acetyl-D-galactosaminyltransferase
MRLTLVISSLLSGGAERVLSAMANYWAKSGKEITLSTLDSKGSDFYDLHPGVKRIGLGLMYESADFFSAIKNNWRRIKVLRHQIILSRPHAVISFVDRLNVLVLLATMGLGLEVIVSERIDPRYHDCGHFWSLMRRVTYSWSSMVVGQTDQVHPWLEEIVGKGSTAAIPNPIPYLENNVLDNASISDVIGASEPAPTVIAMGRFSLQKGFDMLIKAFAEAIKCNPMWRLVILGNGVERKRLIQLTNSLHIAEKVFLPGIIKNPVPLISQADIFVMSSRYEGFPNALMEAMACGRPVISFDCPSGPHEIIRDGVDGVLVPPEDIDALASAIGRLMSDEKERRRLASRAVEVSKRFGLEKVMGMWEAVLDQVLKRSKEYE